MLTSWVDVSIRDAIHVYHCSLFLASAISPRKYLALASNELLLLALGYN